MRVTCQTRYALYAVFDLAYNAGLKPLQVKDISQRQQIPPRYLEQIFQKLKRAEVIRSKRGPKGGYSLARDPSEITLRDVIKAIEGPIGEVFGRNGSPRSLARSSGREENGGVAAGGPADDLWNAMSGDVDRFFASISMRDLCKKGESLGLEKASDRGYMYFI